jgi:hypothetical protein
MTSQITSQSNIALSGYAHLTEDQFGELLATSAPAVDSNSASVESHLLSCKQCACEVASLREAVALFRQATSDYADNQLYRMPRITLPSRRVVSPTLEPGWLVAAAVIVLLSILPMQITRRHLLQPRSPSAAAISNNLSESDEALLEDVDRYTSALVPAPMQALADPTTSLSTPTQSFVQRKD